MKDYMQTGNLVCYWSNLKEHPKCVHGPCLLFGRRTEDEEHKFYACSACRDRKLCSFCVEYGVTLSKHQKQEQEKKKNSPSYPHQKLFIFYNQLMSENPANRRYCHTCERLFSVLDKQKHEGHEIQKDLSDYQMTHPSELLKPLDNSKKEAQYLFSKKAVTDIINILTDLNAENVLCIGTPRIHEYITQNLEGRMSSLLLDFDGRFHNFFGPLNYCWYNLFNHHFFKEESENVFNEFLVQSGGKNMFLICDPPFGGRVEPISQTFKTISDLHKKLNKLTDKEDELKIFFIFPYFMEGVMREKSNPPNISGGLKELKMSDYKVEYDNHPLFISKSNKEQVGSQVRIFTNVPLNLIKLPESDGYKYCKRCEKWVAAENKHCKICKNCTSKDGRRYKHCKLCQRCVKPTWIHCKTCERCSLSSHKCGQKPKVGHCFKCKEIGHTEKECDGIKVQKIEVQKRKSDSSKDIPVAKKSKPGSPNNNKRKKKSLENKTSVITNDESSTEENSSAINELISNREQNKKKKKISKNSESSIIINQGNQKGKINKNESKSDGLKKKLLKLETINNKNKKKEKVSKNISLIEKNPSDAKENIKKRKLNRKSI